MFRLWALSRIAKHRQTTESTLYLQGPFSAPTDLLLVMHFANMPGYKAFTQPQKYIFSDYGGHRSYMVSS